MGQSEFHGSARAKKSTHILINTNGTFKSIFVSVRLASNMAYSLAQRTNCILAEELVVRRQIGVCCDVSSASSCRRVM